MKLWARIMFASLQFFGGLLMGLSVMLVLFGPFDREDYGDRMVIVGMWGFGAMLSSLGFIMLFELGNRYKNGRR